jgi:hypothetical protein
MLTAGAVLALIILSPACAARLLRLRQQHQHQHQPSLDELDGWGSSLLGAGGRVGRRLLQSGILALNNLSPIRIQGITTFANSPAAAGE